MTDNCPTLLDALLAILRRGREEQLDVWQSRKEGKHPSATSCPKSADRRGRAGHEPSECPAVCRRAEGTPALRTSALAWPESRQPTAVPRVEVRMRGKTRQRVPCACLLLPAGLRNTHGDGCGFNPNFE